MAYSPLACKPTLFAIADLFASRICSLPCQFVENWLPLHMGHAFPSTKILHFLQTFFFILNTPFFYGYLKRRFAAANPENPNWDFRWLRTLVSMFSCCPFLLLLCLFLAFFPGSAWLSPCFLFIIFSAFRLCSIIGYPVKPSQTRLPHCQAQFGV